LNQYSGEEEVLLDPVSSGPRLVSMTPVWFARGTAALPATAESA
jgi:hypothetical protein